MATREAREFHPGGSTLLQRIFSRLPLSPFAVAAAGLAVAAFLLAFSGARLSGGAQASPPGTLRPLHAPTGGLVLPHLTEAPELPPLAAPAAKPTPVARRRPSPRPTPRPKPAPRPRRSTKPVVIVGNG